MPPARNISQHGSFDVLVIGAGAAGLAAAAELGRRCWSLDEPGLPVPVELGAEFIHGRPAATFSLLLRAGMVAVGRTGGGWYAERGKLNPTGEIFTEIRKALRRAGMPKKDVSFEAFLARELRHLSPKARAFARRRVEGYDAADPARASARAIVGEWSGEDDATAASHFRPSGGYGALLEWLAGTLDRDRVRLELQTVVRKVRWKRGSVEVEGAASGRPFRAAAARALITLPLGVLQGGGVRFTPALKEKRRALKGLAPSPVLKVALRFRSPFWEKLDGGRYEDAAFFRSLEAPFPSFWTAMPVRAPLLTAWAGGPRARALPQREEELVARTLDVLVEAAGVRRNVLAASLRAVFWHDWLRDPWARGAYAYVAVGGDTAPESLAQPVKSTLFLAGEATSAESMGTVEGALASGFRAAA
ncbi:MAG: FAD-dependent oxidoreductase, partial [Betaproteobacteria bacterium]|nr:FAD-dependent oxidoreductase [Betaproteobacteria bacterium]